MPNVIKEVVEREQKPFWKVLLMILSGVVFVNMLITLSNKLGVEYAGIASIVILTASAVVCGLIIVKVLAVYTYKFIDDKLIFEKSVGSRSHVMLAIDLGEIKSVKRYDEVEQNRNVQYTYKFIFDKEMDEFYVGEFERNNKLYRFIFKPSERLTRIIDNGINREKISNI